MNASPFQSIKNAVNRFPPGIWLMTGLDTLMTIGWSLASPFLALYLHVNRELPMSVVGTVFLIGGLCSGAANLIGGMLCDRLGRRRLLTAVTGLGAVGSTVMAVLVGTSAPTALIAVMFVLARCIGGMGMPVIGAIVADIAPKDRLAECYAVVRTGGNLGFAAGPAIGGFLIGHWSYGWLFALSAAVGAAVTLVVYAFLPETHGGSSKGVDLRSTMAVAGDRRFLVFAVASVLLVMSIGHLGSTMSVFTVDRLGFSTAQYGLLLTTNGLLVVVFQYPVTRLVGNLARAKGLILGSLFYVIGYFSLGWIGGFGLAILTIILITAGEVTLAPISSAAVAESAPPDKRGRYMGFFSVTQTLGYAMSPLFGGLLLDLFPSEPRLIWGIIASAGVLAAICFYIWGKMAHKSQYSLG